MPGDACGRDRRLNDASASPLVRLTRRGTKPSRELDDNKRLPHSPTEPCTAMPDVECSCHPGGACVNTISDPATDPAAERIADAKLVF